MKADWEVEVEKPRFAIARLASLQIESPKNSRTQDEIGVLAALWCGRESIELAVSNERRKFSFGFTSGELQVSCKNGKISTANRFKQEIYKENIEQDEKGSAKREGKVGGVLGFKLPNFLSIGKVEGEVGGEISQGSAIIEQTKVQYQRPRWRVADAGHNIWKVYGFGLNKDNVLENKIIGDEVLCYVIPEDSRQDVSITVRYLCDLKDLWFKYGAEEAAPRTIDDDFNRNRELVASAIVAKALNRSSRRSEGMSGPRLVLLCQQRLVAKRLSGDDNG